MIRKAVPAILLFFTVFLYGGEWTLGETDAAVFLPQSWLLKGQDEAGIISFINPEESIIFQVTVYPGDMYSSDQYMMDDHLEELDIQEQDSSRLNYGDGTASIADAQFLSSEMLIHGWFLFLDRDDYDFYLTVICGEEYYADSLPYILSCLDSFSPDTASRQNPGVISQLISSGQGQYRNEIIEIDQILLEYTWTENREEASRILIEREAGILSKYQTEEEFDEAWKRYYQLIYRDVAIDLKDLALQLSVEMEEMNPREKAENLLSWLQGFEYGSTQRFSDLLTPTEALLQRTGDCDALSLIYIILLREMDIPALLMVSREYAHALAAVSVKGPGAGFDFEGNHYIVAEMTKEVDLGQINAEQARMENWVLVPFEGYEKGNLALD